jgi:hypothetical protein
MAKYEFDKEKFEEWKRAQKESAELQEKMNSSIGGYLESVKKIKELQKNIQFIEQKVTQLKEEQSKAEKDLLENTKKLNKATADGDADEIKALKEKEKELKKILAAKKEGVAITEKELGLLKEQNAALVESAKQTNLISAGLGSAVGFLGKVPGLIGKGFGMLKGTGIFDIEKPILNANKSMAGSEKTYENIFNSVRGAAKTTTMWGVGVKDLAVMQRGYSEAIGKSVMLTEDGYKAMAKLAEGTGLGKEFAVQIAGEMDKFNISAERTSTIVESTMNKAAKIGVNGAAALKSLQNNLKLAQRFNFKGGIAGLAKLSAEATKLRLDMEGIAGMAEKVFRPEGAIEMAAQLTTMGGKFSALGDPMQLMFKARNDFEGFAKDIGKASAEFVEFNKKTGEFNIKNGLAADRMREISQITGISVEKLQEMAEAEQRIQEVRKGLKGGVFNQEDTELISSFAKFKDGKWKIEAGSFSKDLKDLSKSDIARIKSESEALDKRAEDARTFDETLQDLILMFKQQLLPFAQQLKDGLGGPIQEMVAQWKKEGFFKTLRDFVKGAAEMVVSLGKWILNIVEFLGPKGTVIAGLTLALAGKAFTWISNGMLLAQGFKMGTGGMMGGGMPGMPGGGGGGFGVPGGQIGPALPGAQMGTMQKLLGGNVAGGKFAAGTMGSMGLGLGLGVLGTGMQYGRSQMDNPESTGGKWLGVGGTAAQYAGMGAMLGPWGALAGGLIGAGVGAYDEFYTKKLAHNETGRSSNADIWGVNDGIMYHPQDKFLKVNDAVQIAGTSVNGNAKLAQELSKNNSSAPGEMTHKFEDLKITIDVNIPGNEKLGSQLANTPEFIRRINEAINKEIAMAAGGGKLSGSGSKKSSK